MRARGERAREKTGFLLFLAALLCGLGPGAGPAAASPPQERWTFTILRDGSEVGKHEVALRQEGDRLIAEIRIEIAVRLFGAITLYRYEHQGREIWQGDRLLALETATNDNGERFAVRGMATPEGFRVERQPGGEPAIVPIGSIVPTSYWRPELVSRAILLNTQNGEPIRVSAEPKGREPVPAPGGAVQATRYTLSGDLRKEIWYDDRGAWVKSRFQGPDGSTIEYVPR